MSSASEVFKTAVLPRIKEIFPSTSLDDTNSSEDGVTLRIDLNDEKELENFKNEFSQISKTHWIIYRNNKNVKKFQCSRVWLCQLSKRHKKCNRRNADCNAKISALIKKLTPHGTRKDKFLRLKPPLKALIQISLHHTHSIESAETQRMLRVDERHAKEVHTKSSERKKKRKGEILKEFPNFSDFLAWKEEEERKTKAMYTKHRGIAIRKNGNRSVQYFCNRSGIYKPSGSGLRNIKSQGTSKIGRCCPAAMRVKMTSKKVIVLFMPKHEHKMQLEHIKFQQYDRAAIAGAPFTDPNHPDHVPSVFEHKSGNSSLLERYERKSKRIRTESRPAELNDQTSHDWIPYKQLGYEHPIIESVTKTDERYKKQQIFSCLVENKESVENMDKDSLSIRESEVVDASQKQFEDRCTQTDISMKDIDSLCKSLENYMTDSITVLDKLKKFRILLM